MGGRHGERGTGNSEVSQVLLAQLGANAADLLMPGHGILFG